MGVRSLLRSSLIHGSSLFGLDKVFLKARRGTWGLVIGMHETPLSLRDPLQRQLDWVSQHFTIVRLEQFAEFWDGDWQNHGYAKPPVLFTFDDGRESNFSVAAPLLETYGARGVFFVVPAFAECSPEHALEFYRAKINPASKPGDETWEDWRPMSPLQIADLAARGHAIGNHTFSHARLVGLPPEELQREIIESAQKIRGWTQKPVDSFAWTFAWDAVDREAWELVREHHRYCFAPCPGTINPGADSPGLIWRREIEARYTPAEFRFQYSGLGDAVWSSRRSHLRKLLLGSVESP